MEIVIFSISLRDTGLEGKMTIPTTALDHINIPEGDNKVNLRPEDSKGKVWRILCIRLNGHAKPAFTTGWRDFVEDKKLQKYDQVTFSKLEDEDEAGGPQYRIRATRVITLFGVQHVVDLPHP